jgi:hypothetical protein
MVPLSWQRELFILCILLLFVEQNIHGGIPKYFGEYVCGILPMLQSLSR